MKHRGIASCFNQTDGLTRQPNPFLGITPENIDRYPSLPNHIKCALRWISHQQEYERLQSLLSRDSFLILHYRDLQLDFDGGLRALQDFLRLPSPFDKTKAKAPIYDPLKWKAVIAPEEEDDIRRELQHVGLLDQMVQNYCHPAELG